MGKRGPPPKGEYSGMSKVLSTRITPDLRARLVLAAKAGKRSLSQEIQNRLKRTFIDDEKISDAFGSMQNFRIMQMAALAIEQANIRDGGRTNWLSDPTAFHIASGAMSSIIATLAPAGELPKNENNADLWDPIVAAVNVTAAVENASPALPLNKGTRRDHKMGILNSEIGHLMGRRRRNIFNSKKMEKNK